MNEDEWTSKVGKHLPRCNDRCSGEAHYLLPILCVCGVAPENHSPEMLAICCPPTEEDA